MADPPANALYPEPSATSAFGPESSTRASTVAVPWRDVFALTKPRLSFQVMITCGGGLFLAPGHIGLFRVLVALIATAMVVGAANALNSYLERDLDAHMERTRTRPLPTGRLEPRIALVFSGILLAIAIPALTLYINRLTALLGLIALGSYVLVYTPMKQKSALALWVGAIPGAIPPLMGWTAVRDQIEWPGVALFAIMFCWQIPHFIAIAIFRQDEYERAGHRVLSTVRGPTGVNIHATLWCLLLVVSTVWLYALRVEGLGYLIVASVLGIIFFAWTVSGFSPRTPDARKTWARGLFRASLMYLTALFVALSVGAA